MIPQPNHTLEIKSRIKSGDKIMVRCPNHPNAKGNGSYVMEHRLIMELELERFLSSEEVVHHIDGNQSNNSIDNLKLFKNNAEHFAYHSEQRALKACKHSDWLKCQFCKEYDEPSNIIQSGGTKYHLKCRRDWQREYRKRGN